MLALTLTDRCASIPALPAAHRYDPAVPATAIAVVSSSSSRNGFLLVRSACLLVYAPPLHRAFRAVPLRPVSLGGALKLIATRQNCGDVLTKKKLDPHRNQCYGASYTCLDCMVHFPGTSYRSHTVCLALRPTMFSSSMRNIPCAVCVSFAPGKFAFGLRLSYPNEN